MLHGEEKLFDFSKGNTPRPVSASWAGVAAVAKEVANVSAAAQKEIYRDDGVDLWKETARKYSFLGGGLGPAGKLGPAKKYFLESCQFGNYEYSGCCAGPSLLDRVLGRGRDKTFQELAGAAG